MSDLPRWLVKIAEAQGDRCLYCRGQLGPDFVVWPSPDPEQEQDVLICLPCAKKDFGMLLGSSYD